MEATPEQLGINIETYAEELNKRMKVWKDIN